MLREPLALLRLLRGESCTDADWEQTAALAMRHRLVGHLLSAVKKSGQLVPPIILHRLISWQRVSAMRCFMLASQLGHVVELLRDANIPAIAFKGPALSLRAYGELGTRGAGDLDLLVKRHQLPAARAILIEHEFIPGFPTASAAESAYLASLRGKALANYLRSHAEHHLVRDGGSLNVDLHWGIALRELAIPIDPQMLWRNGQTMNVLGKRVQVLSVEHELLVLCVNAGKDGWTRLDRLCDVAALLAQADAARLLDECRRARALRMTLITLAMCRALLKTRVPFVIRDELEKNRVALSIAAHLADQIFLDRPARAGRDILLQWRTRDHTHLSLQYLLGLCCPTVGDQAAWPLPRVLQPLHIVYRPFRLAMQSLGA